MRAFTLDNRLALCASFVRKGAMVADIGTDHAYLPVWLSLNGVINKALACDINEGPLRAGEATVNKYNLADKITLRLSDGLSRVCEDECDDIIIAGMGGELIAKIMSDCEWIKTEGKHYILQPMTKPEILTRYLYENGFEIIKQEACVCDTKHYTVMLVAYTGKVREFNEADCYIGKLDTSSQYSKLYLSHILSHLRKRSIGDKSLVEVINKIEGATANDNSK